MSNIEEKIHIVDGHAVFAYNRVPLRSGEEAVWYHDEVTRSSGLVSPATEEALIAAVRAMRSKWKVV